MQSHIAAAYHTKHAKEGNFFTDFVYRSHQPLCPFDLGVSNDRPRNLVLTIAPLDDYRDGSTLTADDPQSAVASKSCMAGAYQQVTADDPQSAVA